MKREKLMAGLPLIIFTLLIIVVVAGFSFHHRRIPAPYTLHSGDIVPVTDLPVLRGAGVRFTTRAWQGRPYIVAFFASWCPDYRAEHEELMTLAAAHMPVIGITFKDHADKVASYLDREGDPFSAVALDDDSRAQIGWGVTQVPETFVIDARGVIRWHYVGILTDRVASDELMPLWEAVARGGG